VELSELMNRIVRRHAPLFVVFFLAGVGIGLFLPLSNHSEYPAVARFVLDTPDPQSGTESQAIADTARAIATGPSQVAAALRTIGVHRDVADVAKSISVEALGTSGVLELTVSDPDPRVAAALANALAKRVIEVRQETGTGRADQILADLGTQIDDLTRQIVRTDTRLNALNEQIARTTDPQTLTTLRGERDRLSQTADYLAQRRVVLESERGTIATNDALRPQATLLDPAERPIASNPDRRVPDMILGGLFGLLLACGLAAAIEAFKPSVVGADAIAREVDAPVLGELDDAPQKAGAEQLTDLAANLELAALRAQVDHVKLMGTDPSMDLFGLARHLGAYRGLQWVGLYQEALPTGSDTPNNEVVSGAASMAKRSGVGVVVVDKLSPNGSTKVGLLLVTPTTVSLADLSTALNFRTLTGWPLVGVVTYPWHRYRLRRRSRLGATPAIGHNGLDTNNGEPKAEKESTHEG
jgi:capsular polysaccharide biosynthesis protein